MADPTDAAAGGSHAAHSTPGEHGHDGIHLPPNSWAPISLALGMTALFVGFIVGLPLAIIGGLWTIGSIVVWVRGARSEYLELPD